LKLELIRKNSEELVGLLRDNKTDLNNVQDEQIQSEGVSETVNINLSNKPKDIEQDDEMIGIEVTDDQYEMG
jgi:hypothetical protein